MVRGTTAAFKFKLPYPKEELTWLTVKFWQPDNPSDLLPITKVLEHCDVADSPCELCVSLTAEETARFSDKYKAKMQIRSQHTASGTVFGCKPRIITVYPMRDDIIEDDPMLPPVSDNVLIVLDGKVITES